MKNEWEIKCKEIEEGRVIPAAPGWWAANINRENDAIRIGSLCEVIAWRIRELPELGEVTDFITDPITIYGTLDGLTWVVKSPADKWYCSDLDKHFEDRESIIEALAECFRRRDLIRKAAAAP